MSCGRRIEKGFVPRPFFGCAFRGGSGHAWKMAKVFGPESAQVISRVRSILRDHCLNRYFLIWTFFRFGASGDETTRAFDLDFFEFALCEEGPGVNLGHGKWARLWAWVGAHPNESANLLSNHLLNS